MGLAATSRGLTHPTARLHDRLSIFTLVPNQATTLSAIQLGLSQWLDALRCERERPETESCGVEDGVGDRGRDSDDGGFAGSCRRHVLAIDQNDFNTGVSRNRGTRYREKRGLRIRPLSNSMASKSGSSESHDHGALDLVLQMVRVHDGAAIEGADSADDLDATTIAVDGHFGARGDEAAFF